MCVSARELEAFSRPHSIIGCNVAHDNLASSPLCNRRTPPHSPLPRNRGRVPLGLHGTHSHGADSSPVLRRSSPRLLTASRSLPSAVYSCLALQFGLKGPQMSCLLRNLREEELKNWARAMFITLCSLLPLPKSLFSYFFLNHLPMKY